MNGPEQRRAGDTTIHATNHGDVDDDDDDDDVRETSPESAALARGAARAAMTSSSSASTSTSSSVVATARGAVKAGREGGSKGLRSAAGGRAPRSGGGGGPRLPKSSSQGGGNAANLIAKASDRASVGLDVINAGLEHRDHHPVIPPTLVPPRNVVTGTTLLPENSHPRAAEPAPRTSSRFGILPPPNVRLHAAVHAGMEGGSDRHHHHHRGDVGASTSSSNDPSIGKKEGAGGGEDGKSRMHQRQGTHMAKMVEHWSVASYYPIVRRVLHAAGSFVANAILGMAVFATYESMIEHIMVPTSTHPSADDYDDDGGSEDDATMDAMDRATLSQHVLAGATAGSAHALLSLALEMKLVPGLPVPPPSPSASSGGIERSSSSSNPSTWWTSKSMRLSLPPPRYSSSTILHHSLSHSALFGTYQLSKRSLTRLCSHFRSGDNGIPRGGRLDDDDVLRFATIAVSGGLAGQCQHVVGYISERWLGLVAEDARNPPPPSSSMFVSPRRFMTSISWPTWRSTALTFPLSAVGFLAYEYGKLMMTSDDVVNGMA
jgi:hypothetical protein